MGLGNSGVLVSPNYGDLHVACAGTGWPKHAGWGVVVDE